MNAQSPTSADVAPSWVDDVFALPDRAHETFTVDEVTFEIAVESLRLDPRLRPIRIVHIAVPDHVDGRRALTLHADLKSGAQRYARPIEGRIRLADRVRAEDPYAYQRALWIHICGFDRLGFHVTDEASYETLETVTVAHLPKGLNLPFTDAHRAIARQVIGLHDGWRADRNALLVGVATPDYARLMELCAMGYAMRADCVAGRTHFGLTPRGFAEVMQPGETTIWGAIPERIVLRGDDIHGR